MDKAAVSWRRSFQTGIIESIAILAFLPFIFIGMGSPWLGIVVFAAACGLFYALGAWTAPRMVRIVRWLAVLPLLYGMYLLTDAYSAIIVSIYMFSRGGKHQGQWQFLYWLGGFLFHLVVLLWVVRTPAASDYVYLLWCSAFVSIALFLYSFQRQLVRDAAVYHKLITSEILKVGLITVSVLLGVALLLSVLTWVYVGERMVGPLSNFADSFKDSLTNNLGPVLPENLPYPQQGNPPLEGEELLEGNKFITFMWNVIGGFLVPAFVLFMIGFLLYANRREIRAFFFTSSEEKERETLPFTEEQRSLDDDEQTGNVAIQAAIRREEWDRMNYVQKVRTVYRLLVRRWTENGNSVHLYDTPKELGARMQDARSSAFMDSYAKVKYAPEVRDPLEDEELEAWFDHLNRRRS